MKSDSMAALLTRLEKTGKIQLVKFSEAREGGFSPLKGIEGFRV